MDEVINQNQNEETVTLLVYAHTQGTDQWEPLGEVQELKKEVEDNILPQTFDLAGKYSQEKMGQEPHYYRLWKGSLDCNREYYLPCWIVDYGSHTNFIYAVNKVTFTGIEMLIGKRADFHEKEF